MLVPVAMVLVVEAKVEEEEEAVEATVTMKGSSGEAFLSLKSLLERGG